MNAEPLHPDEALRRVAALGRAAGAARGASGARERVPLAEALGRAMPDAATCLVDQPPFAKSAMDGFAWASGGRPGSWAGAGGAAPGPASPDAPPPPEGAAARGLFRVVAAVAAGERSERALGPGECCRIMTGAPLPPGADAVQRVEWTEAAGEGLVRFAKAEGVSNVIGRGENLRAGETLLAPRRLEPQDLGILASSGYAEVAVARRPLVGIVSTGDEIVAPGAPLGPASIYDSNGPQLAAQARAAGCEARLYGAFPDEEAALRAALARALDECDLVLVSGGVSMGDFDYVPKVLASLGLEVRFHGIAMRPGKPTFFGTRGAKAAFGLPGNPVSTFVNFEVLVRPYLEALQGLSWKPRILRARLAEDLSRRGSDRVEFLPARLEAGEGGLAARALRYHGSSMLGVLAEADCLLRMELGAERIAAGEVVDARLLRA